MNVAADGGDFRDAGNRVQLIADEPILQRAQIAQVVAFAFDCVPEDLTYTGRVGTKRRSDAFRQLSACEVQPLSDASASPVQIDRVFEDDVDHREPKRGLSSHGAHVRQALKRSRKWIGQLIFDLLRAAAHPVSKDDHLVVGQVGYSVDRRAS